MKSNISHFNPVHNSMYRAVFTRKIKYFIFFPVFLLEHDALELLQSTSISIGQQQQVAVVVYKFNSKWRAQHKISL